MKPYDANDLLNIIHNDSYRSAAHYFNNSGFILPEPILLSFLNWQSIRNRMIIILHTRIDTIRDYL